MILQKYGDGENFAKIFNPTLQVKCAANMRKSFMGEAPSIVQLTKAYTENQVNAWIMAQLVDLYKYAGVKEKPSMEQLLELSSIIKTEYYFLKASELLLFFYKLKAGEYGTFYGSVDPMVIMVALTQFRGFRMRQIDMYEREEQQEKRMREREEWERNAVPCPSHLKFAKNYITELNKNGD